MIYKPFQEMNLSTLGLGNMRLPTKDGAIDRVEARKIIEYAYAQGVNYFDTAYRYHNGESESFLGEVMQQYPRESWHLASKMPGHMMQYQNGRYEFSGLLAGRPGKSPAQIFEEQLNKCRVDYFDFYLLHNLCETAYDFYTDEQLGVVEFLIGQKKAGRIRHLGFSAHALAETIDRFLQWKDCFEFAQIQLNYMDWTLQEASRKYEVLTRHNLPVIVMEPCRGGGLASLGDASNAALKQMRPNDSIASWAFRFLQSLPNVQVVLSGMSTMEQLQDNIKTFSKLDPTTAAENQMLFDAAAELMNRVPCTGCRYCVEDCPQGLDIPSLISIYNQKKYDNSGVIGFTLNALAKEQLPGACIGCGACSQACPQGIDIPDVMQQFDQLLK